MKIKSNLFEKSYVIIDFLLGQVLFRFLAKPTKLRVFSKFAPKTLKSLYLKSLPFSPFCQMVSKKL